MDLLFIDACPMGEDSRTLKLCEAFIEEYTKRTGKQVARRRIFDHEWKCYTKADIIKRDELIKSGEFADDMFIFAREFAAAKKIIVGAPYWDLSFPAALKAYVESICVNGIAFHYTETGSVGDVLCEKLLYISTAGGFAAGQDFGADYMRGVSKLLGVDEFLSYTAEGLDVKEFDTEQIIKKATADILAIAKDF